MLEIGAGPLSRESPILTLPITRDSALAVLIPGTTTFFRLNTPANAAQVTVKSSGPAGAAFLPALGAQLAKFRLS